MGSFVAMFGQITVEQIAIFFSAILFLASILKMIWSYISNWIAKSNEKAEEWKKIAGQVQQYPEWHDQSIQIRSELNDAISELNKKVDMINKTLLEIQIKNKRNYATTCRYRIIRFNDELLEKNHLHTKEHFDQILDDIDDYEDYCRQDPNYQNSKAVMAIRHIRQVYQKCSSEGTFL